MKTEQPYGPVTLQEPSKRALGRVNAGSVVFLGKILNSHSASLHLEVQKRTGDLSRGHHAMD